MQALSVIIITFNEASNIARCLDSVKSVADEIIVLDSFSTDNTVAIAKKKGAVVKQQQFPGHIQQKNAALKLATYDYVLSLDADEELDEQLIQSILKAKMHFYADAYFINRCTCYCGKFIKHGSWYPDKKIRLFDKRIATWGGLNPHDKIVLTGDREKTENLKGDILHYSYQSFEDHILRNNQYSSISANALYSAGVQYSWTKIIINPFWTFFHGYLIRLGFLDGFYGFVIAINSAHATFQKYFKLRQLNRGIKKNIVVIPKHIFQGDKKIV